MELDKLEQVIFAMGEKINTLVDTITLSRTTCAYTLYAWLEEWYTVYKLPYLKPSGLYQIRNCIDKHIKPHLEDKPLNLIKPIDVQKSLIEIHSTRMQKYALDTISAALKKAYKLDLISYNFSDKLDSVKHVRKQGTSLTREQEQIFIEIIKGSHFENLFSFYLASGCRKSEALAIKWTDIDYSNNRLYIDGTKTICAKRYLPLFDDIKIIISRLPHTCDYIFPTTDDAIKSAWRRLKSKFKLPYCIHSLRHTFSTRHYENGVPAKIIQKWLGHSRVETTQNIYTDVLSDFENKEFIKANNTRKLIQNDPF